MSNKKQKNDGRVQTSKNKNKDGEEHYQVTMLDVPRSPHSLEEVHSATVGETFIGKAFAGNASNGTHDAAS